MKLKGIVTLVHPSISAAKEALKAGIPDWIPGLVATAGTWLGVLGVYSLSGSESTGTYYIAFMIASLVYSLPLSLLTLMFPVLSGMDDGRKRAVSRSVRLTLAIICPLASVVIAYPYVPLSMLGPSYVASSLALQVLMLGAFVSPLTSGFNSLIYAYGKYRFVTLLGLSSNGSRILLYPVLVALWGENGAALSYVSGVFAASVAVSFMARKVGYSMGWGYSLIFAGIPSLAGAAVALTGLHWAIGTAAILATSLLAYTRLGLITRSDLGEITTAFLSRKQLDQALPYAKYILDVLYGK